MLPLIAHSFPSLVTSWLQYGCFTSSNTATFQVGDKGGSSTEEEITPISKKKNLLIGHLTICSASTCQNSAKWPFPLNQKENVVFCLFFCFFYSGCFDPLNKIRVLFLRKKWKLHWLNKSIFHRNFLWIPQTWGILQQVLLPLSPLLSSSRTILLNSCQANFYLSFKSSLNVTSSHSYPTLLQNPNQPSYA